MDVTLTLGQKRALSALAQTTSQAKAAELLGTTKNVIFHRVKRAKVRNGEEKIKEYIEKLKNGYQEVEA